MTQNITSRELLERFCDEWNRYSFYPKLHPVVMVPESFATEVAKAQIEGLEATVALPNNVQDAEQVRGWLSGFSVDKSGDMSIVPLQLAAVDRRGRMAVLDVAISVGADGYVDAFSYIDVFTILSGFSRRKTWIAPHILEKCDYDGKVSYSNYIQGQAREETQRFYKALQAMIKAKIRDVEAKMARKQQKDSQSVLLEELVTDLKTRGLPVDAMLADECLVMGVEEGVGVVSFVANGLTARLTTQSHPKERHAYIAMVLLIREG